MTRIIRILGKFGVPLALVVGTARSASAAPAVPNYLTEQGRLFDSAGAPISATIAFVFTVYSDKDGMTSLWTESKALTLDDGYFSTTLGDTTPMQADLFSGAQRFLGIKVSTDPEMKPLQPLSSVPYALLATNAVGDLTPNSLSIGGKMVIDARGQWVGDTAGLAGPPGPPGAPGPGRQVLPVLKVPPVLPVRAAPAPLVRQVHQVHQVAPAPQVLPVRRARAASSEALMGTAAVSPWGRVRLRRSSLQRLEAQA
jgi:hypothetical protein